MVRTVLWYLFWTLIVILIIVWLLSGGISKIKAAAKSFSNPFLNEMYGGGAVQLPWAVPIPQGADISNLVNGAQGGSQGTSQISSQGSQAETFGNASPYANEISLSSDGATATNPQQEYVVIQNVSQSAIDISGWTLQSALTGARAYIPLGASFFEQGQLNSQTSIELAPGGTAIVTTGVSPVGTSFRENECSGYLEQLQQFTPAIETQCPSPGNVTSQAAAYGQSCSDYVSSIPFCTFPEQPPAGLSPQCDAYIQTTFSYNGCVAANQGDAGFASNAWRIYLDGSRELWNNDHDTIRLLDSSGQTVAVSSY